MKYKSKTIKHLTVDMKISNLCYYNDFYYFESPSEINGAEIVSEEEFAEAINSVVHVEPKAKTSADDILDVLLGVE